MELDDDGFDDLLSNLVEPASPKKIKLDEKVSEAGPSTSKEYTINSTKSKTHCILVNNKQRGNPLLKHITAVPWEYDDIVPDYELGKKVCALFLSLRYHNLNPDYINNRLKELGRKYELQVLLVQIDIQDPHVPIKTLNRICLLADLTLMLAWSPEEAAIIIENYKIYENKPADIIMERIENDPYEKAIHFLSSIKPVNKTDATTLINIFGTLENIMKAPVSRLAKIPGFGTKKAHRLHKVLNAPFSIEP